MAKRCPGCERDLPHNAFGKNMAKADGLQNYCRECRKREPSRAEYQRQYRDANRATLAKRDAERHRANPQVAIRRMAEWRNRNPEKAKELNTRCYRNNRTVRDAQAREWALANPESRRAIVRRYAKAHPEQERMKQSRRRARMRGLPNEHVTVAQLIERDGLGCYLCGRDVDRNELHVDHVVPVVRDGPHIASNLRITHGRCNCIKGSRLVSELDLSVFQ